MAEEITRRTAAASTTRSDDQHPSPPPPRRPANRVTSAGTTGGTVSVAKTLTNLLSIPSNRSCADCRSVLVDSSQVYASYSPNVDSLDGNGDKNDDDTTSKAEVCHPFLRNHAKFAPPRSSIVRQDDDKDDGGGGDGQQRQSPNPLGSSSNNRRKRRSIPTLRDLPVDPAVTAASQKLCGHGVFVCAMCGATHKLLGTQITIVKAVQDTTSWSTEDVQWLESAGGNARSWKVLEAYVSPTLAARRPTSETSIADRLQFIRAKYEALAFVLPPATGPLALEAWENIVNWHPEWTGLWGARLHSLAGLRELRELNSDSYRDGTTGGAPSSSPSWLPPQLQAGNGADSGQLRMFGPRHSEQLPPARLVDHFCVITPSNRVHPLVAKQDLSDMESPEDILLSPQVSGCFPAADSYDDEDFPEHVSIFVFPDGCRASSNSLPPAFFTFVLTNAEGERLYGGALRLYDDNVDTVETFCQILDESDYPIEKRPPWLRQSSHHHHGPSSNSSSPPQMAESSTTSSTTEGYWQQQRRSLESGSGHTQASSGVPEVIFLPKCLVVLSHYPFFDLWRTFLLQIYRIALTEAPLPIERFIGNFVCEVPLPPPGKIQVRFGFTVKDIWTIERPPENQLPMANFSFKPLFACLSVPNVLVVMGCLMQERRVALLSKHYGLLGPVAEALVSLLFPFHWQGIYLPILPYQLLEILDAPVPYLVGLHARYMNETPVKRRPSGVVFVHLDRDEVHLGYEEDSEIGQKVPSLPDRFATKLRHRLIDCTGSVYIPPDTAIASSITSGAGRNLTASERGIYSQAVQTNASHRSTRANHRRRDVLPSCDRAFRENELLVPISGFLSEDGQMSRVNATKPALNKGHNTKFTFKPKRGLGAKGAETERPESESLLDLTESQGFSTAAIRESFLRFFVSLFQNYREYLVRKEFRSEEFLSSLHLSKDNTDFVSCFCGTQLFHVFVIERSENPQDPEVLFFDQSINAKINRSKTRALTLGSKRDTSFLDTSRYKITETFSPPPPSNWGLQEDGQIYHYSTFPDLNYQLFGKIRHARVWQDRRSSLRKRMSTALVQANEQKVVEKASKAIMKKMKTRSVRNLEAALKTLSSPFKQLQNDVTMRTPSSPDRQSIFSEVTLPSTFDMAPEVVHSAEEMVLNARRKHAILLAIIVRLQSLCRKYLIYKRHEERHKRLKRLTPSDDPVGWRKRKEYAAVIVQSYSRAFRKRLGFSLFKDSVISLQKIHRGRVVRLAYNVILASICKVQAMCRGFVVRKLLSFVFEQRMDTYRKQIFQLWKQSYSSIVFRSKFWPIMKENRIVRVALAEREILRLWQELGIRTLVSDTSNGNSCRSIALDVSVQLGIEDVVYKEALKVQQLLQSSSTNSKPANMGSIERLLAERVQVYDRLSDSLSIDPERLCGIFTRFSLPQKEKKKKEAIAKSLWCVYEQADLSADLMMEIFPELSDSTNIHFKAPSKKALRRIPVANPFPPPLDRALWAHRFLGDRLKEGSVEIANVALRLAGCIHPISPNGCATDVKLMKALLSVRGFTDGHAGRLAVARSILFPLDTAADCLSAFPAESNAITYSDERTGVDIWDSDSDVELEADA